MKPGLAGIALLAMLAGCGGGGQSAAPVAPAPPAQLPPAQPPPAQLPPATPQITLGQTSAFTGVVVTMSATSSDPQGSALTYSWAFGDGGSASGTSVTHAYTTEGQFNPRVTATNQYGLAASATATSPLVITRPRPQNFLIFETNTGHFVGQTLLVETSSVPTDANGLPITYLWSFGDGSTASGAKATHTYAAAGTYTVTLTVTNTAGGSSSAQTTARVFAPTPQPTPVDNQFLPYCSGPFCGAASATNYAGPGVGIWRYHNSTTSNATLDIAIQGVSSGQSASLVFTNGSTADALSLPNAGVPMSAATIAKAPPVMAALTTDDAAPAPSADSAHAMMLQRNLAFALEVIRTARPRPTHATAAAMIGPIAATPPPALGTSRVWYDNFSTSTPYTMEVAATCALPTGRNAVFWLDSAQVASGVISRARIDFMVSGFCGANGVYARQVALTGDVWGPAANSRGFIEDAPGALQDIHIVIPGVPDSTTWGGYFSASNIFPRASGSTSNGQLALFINPFNMTHSPADVMAGATLAHELKHLVNFYQRALARNVLHPPWLEETSAMLSEDLFTPSFLGFNRAEIRHDGYVFSGGGIGYLGWTHPDGQSYNQGGSVGAFLHRRYGLDVDRRLVDTCADTGTPISGYQCLDTLIRQWGGYGFADDFARLGASIFGGMGRGDFPYGFGLPAVIKEGILLQAFSSASVRFPPSNISPRAITQFLATMHTYQLDYISTGQTTYRHNGVVVPAGTTLMLVIQ